MRPDLLDDFDINDEENINCNQGDNSVNQQAPENVNEQNNNRHGDLFDELDIDDPEEKDIPTKMHEQLENELPINVVISFFLNPNINTKYCQLKSEILSKLESVLNIGNFDTILNGKYINDKDNEDISIEKYRATPVFISFCLKGLDESCELSDLLYNLVNLYGCGEIAFTTKTKDGTFDVRYYKEEELTGDGLEKIREPFNEFYEEIKYRTKHIEEWGWIKDLGWLEPEEFFFLKNVGGEKTFKFNPIYHCGGLMMYNLDSSVELDDECLEYMNQLIDKWLPSNAEIPCPCDTIINMLPCSGRKPDIPIILRKEMPSYSDIIKGIDDRYIPKGQVLGYYTRDDEEYICNGPHIVLSPDNILKSANSCGVPFKVLITKILVHEIGHALMDRYRITDDFGILFTDSSKNWALKGEANAMEESLANAIALAAFKQHAPNDYKYVRHYINEMQSSIYKFGLWQEKINADWTKWRNHSKENTDKLKEWFNKCFKDGHIVISQEDYTQELFNEVFSEDQKAAQ